MKKFVILLFLLISIIILLYLNLDILIHHRYIHPYILKIFNHPLYNAYNHSLNIEKMKKNNNLVISGGFTRIAELIQPPSKIYNVSNLMDEINLISDLEKHERLGNPLSISGKKKSWNLRIFNENTKYTKYAPKCLNIIDNIANDMKSDAISVSLAFMYPKTWLKYHEGFWGYGEYITRCILGVQCVDGKCALHVFNEKPQSISVGKVITFDDCKMHEAWNISDENRIVLIFDLCNTNDFNNKNALSKIKDIIDNRQINTNGDMYRKNLSLKTIETVKKQIIDNN